MWFKKTNNFSRNSFNQQFVSLVHKNNQFPIENNRFIFHVKVFIKKNQFNFWRIN